LKPSNLNPAGAPLTTLDISRTYRGRQIRLRLATADDSLNLILSPAECATIGQALTEYAEA
jgi:hypothetical protein